MRRFPHDARMFFGSLELQLWHPVRYWDGKAAGFSRDAAAVLTTAGALTRFLDRHFGMRLDVYLHDQFVDSVAEEEAVLLTCDAGSRVLRRRVSLLHRGVVMFDAESVLPLACLPSALMADLEEGKRPLANLLLDRGMSLSRSELAVAQIESDDDAFHGRWARRSVLRAPSGTEALVVELFQAEMWRRIDDASRRYPVQGR